VSKQCRTTARRAVDNHLKSEDAAVRRRDGSKGFGFRTIAILLIAAIAVSGRVAAAAPKTGDQQTRGADAKQLAESRRRAVEFLKASQADDGSWTSNGSGGVTALVVMALIKSGVPLDDPTVAKGLQALEKLVQKDGGIYARGSGQKNYETCVCVMTLKGADVGGKYDAILARADKFLRGLQWDEKEGIDKSDNRYGGADYGPSKRRPDLSNTQFLLDALKSLGAKDNDPSIQKALVFVSRCQNLESEHNTTSSAAKVNDGGFIYTVASGGQSAAGKARGGGLRSYGAMTYAGLKSMIYAGLTESDPRVKAAFGWIRSHYTVTENPGMGVQGLYYYYDTFSKTLDVLKIDEFEDAQHAKHDWRKDLATQLFAAQQPNGSWVNPKGRWFEGDPNLATAYALCALKFCEPVAASSN
jgi:squalene-hopene/tetraprenyl-beta-curcumene cyclase